jgi:hypothetical protein
MRCRLVVLLTIIGLLVTPGVGMAQEAGLVRLASDFKWPGISSLIAYRGRLWFVNSVKFVNHNSADLYSYDPATGRTRYEKHLFSQDAGDPVVADGLLYWPYEDSRFSPGHGEFMATNGKGWVWRVIPAGRAFHTHSMTTMATKTGTTLLGATSAWKGRIVASDDRGENWRLLYEYPTPDGNVSRFTTLAVLNDALFAGITTWYDNTKPKLLRWDGKGMGAVPGWPAGNAVRTMATHRGWVYASNESEKATTLLRTDGERVEPVSGIEGTVEAFHSDGTYLWAVTIERRSGMLWRSRDGASWEKIQKFDQGRPLSVATLDGKPYVGLLSNGGGTLWGPPPHGRKTAPTEFHARLPEPPAPLDATARAAALKNLDEMLGKPAQYRRLRSFMQPLALDKSAITASALMKRLEGPFPDGDVRMFGGRRRLEPGAVARWYLLWGIAHTGFGTVPTEILRTPWKSVPNRSEKYLEPAAAAVWAVARLGQKDKETLSALIERLDMPSDPDWFRGDIIGALTDLTGQRFGYDVSAWKRWWATRP